MKQPCQRCNINTRLWRKLGAKILCINCFNIEVALFKQGSATLTNNNDLNTIHCSECGMLKTTNKCAWLNDRLLCWECVLKWSNQRQQCTACKQHTTCFYPVNSGGEASSNRYCKQCIEYYNWTTKMRKCKRCNEEHLFLWFNSVPTNDYLCFNCFIDVEGQAPVFAGTEFDENGDEVDVVYEQCQKCGTANSNVVAYTDGVYCWPCRRDLIEGRETSTDNDGVVCAECKATSSPWWSVNEKDEFVCINCYKPGTNTAITVSGTPTHSGITINGQAMTNSTAITTTNNNVTTAVKTPPKPRCLTCYSSVDNYGEQCSNCKTFFAFLDQLGEGRGMRHATIDVDALRDYCTSPESWFWELPNAQHIVVDAKSNFTYINNNKNILFVAHLDKASGSMDREIFHAGYVYDKDDHNVTHPVVYNGNLDDRLGAFIGHYLLPVEYGIEFDVLFTTNEETGGSTAEHFYDWWEKEGKVANKSADFQYNWIIEFDRRGTDVVLYQFEDTAFRNIIGAYATVGQGSFSDISHLDTMNCKAMNWGTGYVDEHTQRHKAFLENTVFMVENFVNFYRDYSNVHLPHDATQNYKRVRTYGSAYYGWDDEDYDYYNGRWSQTPSNNDAKSTQYVCENCGENCVLRYAVDDPESGERKQVCGKCRTLVHKERLGSQSYSTHLLVCERCDEIKPLVFVVQEDSVSKDVCYECLQRPLKAVKVNNILQRLSNAENMATTISAVKCDFCGEWHSNVFEEHGFKICKTCHDLDRPDYNI